MGMLYRYFSNSRLSLAGGRGKPLLREGDAFLVDVVEEGEVEMVREGCRAAEVWRVSELRGLDGLGFSRAAQVGGSLERLVGKGSKGSQWGDVVRRASQFRGVQVRGSSEVKESWSRQAGKNSTNVLGRMERVGARSKCSQKLGSWNRWAVWDWGLVAWAEGGVIKLGVPQSGPGGKHLECRQMVRTDEAEPAWLKKGS